MFWTIVAILVILWLLGFSFKLGGKAVHTLVVIALILIILKVLGLF